MPRPTVRFSRSLLAPASNATLVSLCAALLAGSAAAQQTPPRGSAIIVLDGSNSMNARLPNDKVFKHVAVREALRAALPDSMASGNEIGLAAFGARREKDCNDAEVIVQPSADPQRIVGALEKFQPRGFSPVSLAMRTAAKALPSGGARASMILVLDDLASCRGEDPCAVATDLKRQNANLAIHVVGLGLKRPDALVLACITKQTGGQLIEAVDGPAVGPAVAQALKLAGIDKSAPVEARPAVAAPAPKAVARAPERRPEGGAPAIDETQPGVHFTARLADGRPLLGVPLRWRVYSGSDADAASTAARGEAVADVTAAAFTRVLSAGRFVAEASAGLVNVRRAFEVTGPGPTRVSLILDAALLNVATTLAKGAGAAEDVRVIVSGGGESQDQSLAPLWISRAGSTALLVPPGAYRLKAEAGVASAERAIAVSAGVASDIEIDLAAGRLVVEEAGGPPPGDNRPPQIVVSADDPDSSGARRELHRVSATRLDLTVPAGTYLVTIRRGESETRERYVVRPGETARRSLAPAIARVRLSSRGAGAPRPGLELHYRIERLEGAARVYQRWGETEPVIDLTPGRYRFEARLGGQNAVTVREADIKAGFEHRVELDLAAGAVQLKLPPASVGLGLGDVYWHIQDERGATVWRTIDLEPVVALGIGRYRVRAEVKDRELEQAIDVKAGAFQVVELGG